MKIEKVYLQPQVDALEQENRILQERNEQLNIELNELKYHLRQLFELCYNEEK